MTDNEKFIADARWKATSKVATTDIQSGSERNLLSWHGQYRKDVVALCKALEAETEARKKAEDWRKGTEEALGREMERNRRMREALEQIKYEYEQGQSIERFAALAYNEAREALTETGGGDGDRTGE